jgi:hypothetical protein
MDYTRYHLENHIAQSVGISLLRHEYDDLMASQDMKNMKKTDTHTATPVFSSSAQDVVRIQRAIRPSSDWIRQRRGTVRPPHS